MSGGAAEVALASDPDRADAPTLDGPIRAHLGRLLAAVYMRDAAGEAAEDRFAELLARLGAALSDAGDAAEAAFRTELLATLPALRRFALSLAHAADQADDLVQEAMLRAWRSRAGFQPGTNIEAWTFTILRNLFYSSHRKRREVADEDGAQTARLVAVPDQDDRLDLRDVQAALARLRPEMREALLLVTLEDVSYEVAAAILGCQLGTVKSRVWRARNELVRLLGYDGRAIGQDNLMRSAAAGTQASASRS